VTPIPTTGGAAARLDMVALRAGDPAALAAAYRLHAGPLLRTLRGFLANQEDAEDVLHDLFVGLPEALGRYEDRGVFGGWLRRVALRLALQRLRSRGRRREVGLEHAEPVTRASAEALPDQLAVERALASLPESMRTVVVLRELEGWAHQDIADFLGIREGAVMTRHCRAMKRLRLVLEDDR
jgi:RNA polymerase sigma-70 factor (ECF subfamily)